MFFHHIFCAINADRACPDFSRSKDTVRLQLAMPQLTIFKDSILQTSTTLSLTGHPERIRGVFLHFHKIVPSTVFSNFIISYFLFDISYFFNPFLPTPDFCLPTPDFLHLRKLIRINLPRSPLRNINTAFVVNTNIMRVPEYFAGLKHRIQLTFIINRLRTAQI